MKFLLCTLALCAGSFPLFAQQVPDTTYVAKTSAPAFPFGKGPRLLIDGGHVNFHTVNGRYSAFARLAARDGFRVSGSEVPLTDSLLATTDILVIANPLNPRNANNNWSLPTPSAYSADEIAAVHRWVSKGGAILLIADHMPFAGAAEDMGAAFGITWINGFAYDAKQNSIYRYTRSNGIVAHPIFTGRKGKHERVDSVVAFTGSAFWLPSGGAPLLRIPQPSRVLMPLVAWQFSDSTPSISAAGMLQAAAIVVGKGRVVAAGEAAIFSAQRQGPQQNPMGFNDPTAPQNAQFVLNVLHWLSGLLPTK